MWPPQSVNTWPTPAPLSVRATSSPPVIQSEEAGPLRTSPAVIASASEIYRLASPAPAARTAAPRRPAARPTPSTDSPPPAGPPPPHRPPAPPPPPPTPPRPAGPQPRDGLRLARPHPQTRLGRRGPNPATACGSHGHSPEFLPLDGLAVEALGDEDVADAMDHRLAPADVGDEPGDVGDQTRDRLGEATRSVPRGARSARHHRMVREAGVPPGQRAERRVVCEPARVARPLGERRAAPEARRVELGQDRADRHDTDLLGDEERTPRIGAGENEAAERPLEADGVAGLEAPEPLRADSAGSHVGAEREPRGELRRRGDRVGADGPRAERDRHPLARGKLERGRLLQPKVDLQDLG